MPGATLRDQQSEVPHNLLPYYALPNSHQSTCYEPSEILLYINLYLVFACLASLVLGAKSVRAGLSHNRFFSSDFIQHPHVNLPWISVFGSLLINISATALTAHILSISNAGAEAKQPPFHRMFFLWVSRPLPSVLITWLSILDRAALRDNARKVTIVDSIYGVLNIYLFGTIARITDVSPPNNVPPPARFARAGSALWLLAFVSSVIWLLVFIFIFDLELRPIARDRNNKGKNSYSASLWSLSWSFLDGLRFMACWLLWVGLLFSNKTAFCPSHRTWNSVTVIWLFVPFIDALWKGFATCKEPEERESEHLMDI